MNNKVLIFIIAIITVTCQVYAATYTVNKDNTCAAYPPYGEAKCSIQDTLDAAADGDTIYIKAASQPANPTYEPITITKAVTLTGLTSSGTKAWTAGTAGVASGAPVIKYISPHTNLIKVSADNVEIMGLNFVGRQANAVTLTALGTQATPAVSYVTLSYCTYTMGTSESDAVDKGIAVDYGSTVNTAAISYCKFTGQTTNTSNWLYVGENGSGGSANGVKLTANQVDNAMAKFELDATIKNIEFLNNTFSNSWTVADGNSRIERPYGYVLIDEPTDAANVINGITFTHNTFSNSTGTAPHEFAILVTDDVEEADAGGDWESNLALHCNNFLQGDANSPYYPIVGFEDSSSSASSSNQVTATSNWWYATGGPRSFDTATGSSSTADVSSYVDTTYWARGQISGGSYAELSAVAAVQEITGTQMLSNNMYLQVETTGGAATLAPTKYVSYPTGTSALSNGIAYFSLGLKSGAENIGAITATFYAPSGSTLASSPLYWHNGSTWAALPSNQITTTSASQTIRSQSVSETWITHTFGKAVTAYITQTASYVTPTINNITRTSIHTMTQTFFALAGTTSSSSSLTSSTTSSSSSSTSSSSTTSSSLTSSTTSSVVLSSTTTTSSSSSGGGGGGSHAREAETLFIESDATSATVYGSSYLRCRILILDANGGLATSFGGADITDSTFTLTAVNNGTDITFATDPATDSSPTFSYGSGDSFGITNAWQEFAVNVDNVDEQGDEIIRATLEKSGSKITADLHITIVAPEANTYVVLTGGVSMPYNVLDEFSAVGQDDKGARRRAGDTTVIDVYASYYRASNGKLYFTDNVPEEMLRPTISGIDGHGYNIGMATGTVILNGGHATASIQVKDLKLDDYLAYRVGTWNTAAKQMAAMSWIMANGMTVTWSASAGYTRLIGAKFGDVNSSEQVEISMFDREKYYGSPTSYSSRTDRSFYTPGTCENITILGLPVNEVTNAGAHKESGTLAVTQAPGTSNISPLDAYFLAPDPLKKPSGGAFKTAGDPTSSTKIYGAVVSYDQYNNPAPFSSGSNAVDDTKIYLKHTNAAGSNTEAINATLTGEVTSPYVTMTSGAAYISNTYASQAFFPFIMAARTGQTSALTNCFIDQITVDGSAIDEDSFEDTVSTENLGVDFVAQNTIGAITQTVATDITIVQDDDTEIEIIGRGTEKSYEMYAIRGADGVKMNIGPEEATSGSSSVDIAFDEDETAKSKVVFFTTAPGNSATVNPYGWSRNIHMIFLGDDGDTYVQSPVVVTANTNYGIKPAEGGDVEPAAISFIVKTANVTLDPAEEHNVANYASSVGMWSIMVFDGHMNMYTLYGNSSIEDAELSGAVYDVVDGVTAETANAAHSVEIDTNTVSVEFDLESITADQEAFVVKLTSDQGNTSGQATIKPHVMKRLALANIFLAVPGVDDTPIEGYFASQIGKPVTPVSITGITNTTGNLIDVALDATNGTISAGSIMSLTTAQPRMVFTAKPFAGVQCMQISADPEIMGIDDVFLDLCFESDFEPPMISSVSSGYCSIIITVSDDVAVDTANTAVVVKSANGNNITDLLTRTNMDNGSLGSIILQPTQIGLYSVTILPKDKSGNFGDEETRVISVNQCDGVNTTTSIPSAGGAGGSGGSSGGAPPPPVPECLETSDCDDGRYCDPKTSTCVECLQTSHCDDGLFCNGSESCYNNECVDGTSPCEQNETCHEILDTCLPEPECSTDAECDDGFFCNGQERCNEYIGICEQGEPPCNPDQLCMEALQECWGTKVLTAQSLQTVIKRPLIKEQRCPWLLLRVADDNHVDQSSTSALLGPSAEASGVAFDQSRAIFRFWRLIFVPICIDKDAAAGTWNLTIETDLKNPANLLKEIIKASFEIR